jgi:hypothetical protein
MPEDRGSAWSGVDLPGLPQRVLKILLPLRETVKIGHPSAQLRVFLFSCGMRYSIPCAAELSRHPNPQGHPREGARLQKSCEREAKSSARQHGFKPR